MIATSWHDEKENILEPKSFHFAEASKNGTAVRHAQHRERDYLDVLLLYNVFNKLSVITSKISWDYLDTQKYNQFPDNTDPWFEFVFWPETSKEKLCVSIVIYVLLQFFIYDS